jgi:hypothetical protein
VSYALRLRGGALALRLQHKRGEDRDPLLNGREVQAAPSILGVGNVTVFSVEPARGDVPQLVNKPGAPRGLVGHQSGSTTLIDQAPPQHRQVVLGFP